MTGRRRNRLCRDRRGATIVEFALILPTMMVLIMGLGDILYQQYAQSILSGAVQKAGRDSTLQGIDTSLVDGKVITAMSSLLTGTSQSCPASTAATWCSRRYAYDTFTEVAPEPFTDTDNDGLCNHGEPFSDVNANGSWDANPGATGQGGANAVALYTMTMTYRRLFPVAALLGWSSTATITSTTLLKNQPYASQTTTTTIAGTCT